MKKSAFGIANILDDIIKLNGFHNFALVFVNDHNRIIADVIRMIIESTIISASISAHTR